MKKSAVLIATITIILFSSFCFKAISQRTQKKAEPVTTIIEGTGSLLDPAIPNYRIQSDHLGPYRNGVDSVVSVLQTGGDWQLDGLASPTRTVLLDFRDPVPNSNANPPFLVGQALAKIETKSYLLYGNGKVSSMTGLNSTLITPLIVRFDINGNSYRIWMNSQNYPQTNYALVMCVEVEDPNNPTTSRCKKWRIEPSVTQPDGQSKNISKLVRFYTSKGKTIEENLGDFYFAFSINFSNP